MLCFGPERSGLPRSNSQHEHRLWDVAIVGAGMGGGFAARALADAGRDVLLIDRGNEERSAAIGTRHLRRSRDAAS